MDRSASRKRPWLAALLAALVAGLGHLYLRRWRRALAWVGILFVVSVALAGPGVLETYLSTSQADTASMLPVLVVLGVSAVDAYLLAYAHNGFDLSGTAPEDDPVRCPNCGKQLDTDLEFCHWCTDPIDGSGSQQSDTGHPND